MLLRRRQDDEYDLPFVAKLHEFGENELEVLGVVTAREYLENLHDHGDDSLVTEHCVGSRDRLFDRPGESLSLETYVAQGVSRAASLRRVLASNA